MSKKIPCYSCAHLRVTPCCDLHYCNVENFEVWDTQGLDMKELEKVFRESSARCLETSDYVPAPAAKDLQRTKKLIEQVKRRK